MYDCFPTTNIEHTIIALRMALNAILPMEFLIPTLKVANLLEWIGHKLFERFEQLEKLDETRLFALIGMYT